MKIISEEIRRKENDLKSKADLSQKTMIDIKREV
jgi:hypothetical protein